MKRISVVRKASAASALAVMFAMAGGTASAATAASTPVWPCHYPWCAPSDALGYIEANPSLIVRTAPCLTESQCGFVRTLPYGKQVAIRCYERGDWVSGWGGTTNVWDLLIDDASGGDGFYGWASDAWINTGGDTSTMVSAC